MNQEQPFDPKAPQGAPPHTDSSDFQHGYASGLEQVSRDSYEGYLSIR